MRIVTLSVFFALTAIFWDAGIEAHAAQTAASSNTTPGKPAGTGHKRKAAAKPAAPVTPLPERLPDPPPPDWPANDPAKPASVDWNGQVLRIAATNSSLQQILSDVSTATGVKLEGTTGDQRVYGNYGPAPAREVLRQLLDGSGYNILMVGDQGQGTPRRLVLTTKTSHGPATHAANAEPPPGAEEEPPEEPEPQEDNNQHRQLGVPAQQGPPNLQNRTPQEVMQEMQQRQQQLQQQLQQQQQQAQPGQTPN